MKLLHKKLPEIHVWKNDSKRKYIESYSSNIIGDNLGAYFVEGGSACVNATTAKRKAIFEAVERYSGSKIPLSLKTSSYPEIQYKAANPKDFIFFSADQFKIKGFPYKKYSPDDKIEWLEGDLLTQRNKILLPAFAVYLGYNQRIPDSKKYFPTASSGLALHDSSKASIVNGILELIERDAAMKIWLNKLRFPVVDLTTIRSPGLRRLLNNIKKDKLIAKVILSSQELSVPSFVGILYSQNKISPFATFGLSAGAHVEQSIQKCLEEALMVRGTMENMKNIQGDDSVFQKSQSQVKSFLDHCLFYSLPEKKIYWQFMIEGPTITINQIEKKFNLKKLSDNTYESLVNVMRKGGYDTYAVNLTSDIARKMGFHCSKVIIPRLRQMEIDNNLKFLRYGSESDRFKLEESLPHPFG